MDEWNNEYLSIHDQVSFEGCVCLSDLLLSMYTIYLSNPIFFVSFYCPPTV